MTGLSKAELATLDEAVCLLHDAHADVLVGKLLAAHKISSPASRDLLRSALERIERVAELRPVLVQTYVKMGGRPGQQPAVPKGVEPCRSMGA